MPHKNAFNKERNRKRQTINIKAFWREEQRTNEKITTIMLFMNSHSLKRLGWLMESIIHIMLYKHM